VCGRGGGISSSVYEALHEVEECRWVLLRARVDESTTRGPISLKGRRARARARSGRMETFEWSRRPNCDDGAPACCARCSRCCSWLLSLLSLGAVTRHLWRVQHWHHHTSLATFIRKPWFCSPGHHRVRCGCHRLDTYRTRTPRPRATGGWHDDSCVMPCQVSTGESHKRKGGRSRGT
jgi:hypothetical protein